MSLWKILARTCSNGARGACAEYLLSQSQSQSQVTALPTLQRALHTWRQERRQGSHWLGGEQALGTEGLSRVGGTGWTDEAGHREVKETDRRCPDMSWHQRWQIFTVTAVKTRAQFLSGSVAESNSCLSFSWCRNVAVKCDRNLEWGCSAHTEASYWVLCWLRCLLDLKVFPAEGKLTVPGGICAFTICPFQKRKRNYINLF